MPEKEEKKEKPEKEEKKEKVEKEKEKKEGPQPVPPTLNREQLEALRRKLQKKFH